MKKLILLFAILLASQIRADRLWSVNELYEMSEVIYSSRGDYDGGMSLSFLESYEAFFTGKGFSHNGKCFSSSTDEVLNVVKKGISNHLRYYPDEEFDFSEALVVLEDNLSRYSNIYECAGENGNKIFISGLNEFILSYEIL